MTAILAAVCLLVGTTARAQQWASAGNPGGGAIKSLLRETQWLIAAADAGLYHSSDQGRTWSIVSAGAFSALARAGTGTLIAGALDGRILRSVDGGAQWTGMNAGLPALAAVRSLAWSNGVLLVGTNLGVYQKHDDSTSFEASTMLGLANANPWGVVADDQIVRVATYRGPFSLAVGDTLWRAPVTGPGDFTFALDGFGQRLFAATLDGIKISNDDGITWTDSLDGLMDSAAFDFQIAGTRMFVASSNGVLVTGMRGKWRDVSEGLPASAVLSLTSFATNLFAGLANGDVFTRDLNTFTGIEETGSGESGGGIVVNDFAPSPARDELLIRWTIMRNAAVRLAIVDALGSVVVNKTLPPAGAGAHSTRIDVAALASGVYHLEVSDGESRDAVPVVIVH
jgi:hypothetical protein